MKQLFNSRERTAEEWRRLFKEADIRFCLEEITTSPGSALSVIEVRWIAEALET
jgi:hypothetical protein